MFNSVEYVRKVCKEKGISIARLEKDCGFANGYLNPKKMQKIPYDRAMKIAEYLGINFQYILFGENETADTLMSAANQMYGVEKEKPAAPEGSRLDAELMKRLMALTPDEEKQVDAFVQGLLASRKD